MGAYNFDFRKVVYIGPPRNGKGGMSTVMDQYSRVLKPFRAAYVNSVHGKVTALGVLTATLFKLIAYRLTGSRIMHIHYAGQRSWLRENAIASFGRALGYRTVMHCHCSIIDLSSNQGIDTVRRKLQKADANIVLASVYSDYAREKLNLKSISFVPNFMCGTADSSLDIASTSPCPTFLYLGLLNQQKGFFDLLYACGKLAKQGKKFKLIVGGIGDMPAVRRLISQQRLDKIVELRGWITGPAKDQAMKEADVLVLPSYSEGMPMSVIEAFRAGRPVVATKVGAVPDMIENGVCGFVNIPGDIDALARNMCLLIDKPELLQRQKEAALKKSRDYTPDSVIPILASIYKSIL